MGTIKWQVLHLRNISQEKDQDVVCVMSYYTDEIQAAFPLELQYKYVNDDYEKEKNLEHHPLNQLSLFITVFCQIFSKKVWGSLSMFYCHM